MDSRIIKAVINHDVKLAKTVIADSTKQQINHIFRDTTTSRPYTILDATLDEAVFYNINHPIKQIVLELRSAGARTYNELSKPVPGLPPFSVKSRHVNEVAKKGIANSKRNNSNTKNGNGDGLNHVFNT